VLYVDFSCALLTTEVFFLEADKYRASIAAPYIAEGALVRRLWAMEGEAEDCTFWSEGKVYHIEKDYATKPFRSVSVLWSFYDHETQTWMLTDNPEDETIVCPWDLEPLDRDFPVHVDSLLPAPIPIPEQLLGTGSVSARGVLMYLNRVDHQQLFRDDTVTDSPLVMHFSMADGAAR
jgi:hypothetical protein